MTFRKRLINGPENAHAISLDDAFTSRQQQDADYLDAGGELRANASTGTAGEAGRTAGWTPATWSSDADKVLTVTNPLDDEQGVGILDAQRAIYQHQAGKQAPGNVNKIGWDLNQASLLDSTKSYRINQELKKGQFLTVTLAWDRITRELQESGAEGNNIVEANDIYTQ